MNVDKMLREMIREELASVLAPIRSAIEQLEEQGSFTSQLQTLLGVQKKRGPGRPRKIKLGGLGAFGKGRRSRGSRGSNDRGCAVAGCKRPARSKGYCAAHYQKFRMLSRTKRLPSDWVPHAAPGSVKNLVLPRGRAGARALAEARGK